MDEFYKSVPIPDGPPLKKIKLLPNFQMETPDFESISDSAISLFEREGLKIPIPRSTHLPMPEERRYKCSFCSKGFKRREHLINHERVHTGEKPFKCELCDAAFGDPSNWRKHKKKHLANFESLANMDCLGPASMISGLNSDTASTEDNNFISSSSNYYDEHDKATAPLSILS